MNIKYIKIKNYKSVHSTQTIEFTKNGLITFIGKNGSGKTNLLEAINGVFKVNTGDYFRGYTNLSYSITIELDNRTIRELSKNLEYESQDRYIEVYNDGYGNNSDELKVKLMQSSLYAKALREAASEVKNAAAVVSEKLSDFKKALAEIKVDDGLSDGYFYTIDDVRKSEAFGYDFNYYRYNIDELIKEVDKMVNTILENEREIELYEKDGYGFENRYVIPKTFSFPAPDFRLSFREPYMTELDKRFIVTADWRGIKKVIDEINKRIAEQSSGLREAVKALNDKIGSFELLIRKSWREEERNYNRFKKSKEKKRSFLEGVKNAIGRKCYYIPAAEQFGSSRDRYDYGYRRNFDYNRLLTETYITLKYEGEERDKILTAYEKGHDLDEVLKDLGIDKAGFAADFENELNKNLPAFDRDMIAKTEVKYDGRLELFIVEKDGSETPFEETSTGRRWYFAYYFIKSCLKQDDVLILDEPGVFLHPEAQVELLRELQELAKEHIVIMCTHSPYMISETSAIHHVQMTENGTTITRMRLKSLEKHYKNAGFSDFNIITLNNTILNISDELIICEGERDIACIKAFMDYFGIDKKKYLIMQMNGWTHAKPLIEFYLNNNMNVRILLDKDIKEKIRIKIVKVPPELGGKGMEIGELPEERLTLVYAGSKKYEDKEDIEGLFSDKDRDIFLEKVTGKKKMKVRMDIGKILLAHGCDTTTKRHFEALFRNLKLLPENKGASN